MSIDIFTNISELHRKNLRVGDWSPPQLSLCAGRSRAQDGGVRATDSCQFSAVFHSYFPK